jgi:starvation-inducible DNA-binding protein
MNLSGIINKQVANWSVLYIKLHQYHWYVKGQQFFTLHTKFEELYNEASTYIDELAERLLALGGQPVATMTKFLEIATVQEAEGSETAEQMVQVTIDDFTKIIDELKEGLKIAQSVNDEATSDLFLGIHASLEKHVWMLGSFLGK